jgi:hypothetical protein
MFFGTYLIDQQDQLITYQYTFFMSPQRWAAYNLADPFNWEIYPFQQDQVENVPSEPGIYSFVIQPGIATHPACSYLMYIGKTERTLRQRFREYCREQQNVEGRPKIVRLLNKYQGYLYFCCSPIAKTDRIGEIEDALIKAFLPPCNDQFPAGVRRVIGAF